MTTLRESLETILSEANESNLSYENVERILTGVLVSLSLLSPEDRFAVGEYSNRVSLMNDLKRARTENERNRYDLAVERGFTGTVEQWITEVSNPYYPGQKSALWSKG